MTARQQRDKCFVDDFRLAKNDSPNAGAHGRNFSPSVAISAARSTALSAGVSESGGVMSLGVKDRLPVWSLPILILQIWSLNLWAAKIGWPIYAAPTYTAEE